MTSGRQVGRHPEGQRERRIAWRRSALGAVRRRPGGGDSRGQGVAERLRTGTSPLANDEMLEPIAVIQAARESHNTANAVDLSWVRLFCVLH